jgi:hypothetical protein
MGSSEEEEKAPLLSPSSPEPSKPSTSTSLAIPTTSQGSTNSPPENPQGEQEEEEEREPTEEEKVEEMKFYANQVVLLILPIFLTFVLTIWWARDIFYDVNIQSSFAFVFSFPPFLSCF